MPHLPTAAVDRELEWHPAIEDAPYTTFLTMA